LSNSLALDLKRLAQVRCFLLDMDGTFYLGNSLLPGAHDLLAALGRRGIDYLFLTNNSSHNRAFYAQKLRTMGLDIPDERVFTSGEATALMLAEQKPGARIFLMGTPDLQAEFSQHGFELVEDEPDVVVLGFDTTLTYNRLWRLCDLVRAGLPYVATHADLNCPIESGGFMPDAGAMIAFVEASTGRKPDVVVGKPNRPIIETLMRKTSLPAEALCMVGDRLYTDVAMGAHGIVTVLVLSGETKREDLRKSPYRPNYVMENLVELAMALWGL
jgi:HAD superfamily hydrolase (TIGR01450 family)